ncbi:MAG: alkaline phosphatase, partial [Planctomycetes bacterium]|nr:alkaline phosphatase [Planctomycetota bacterium]
MRFFNIGICILVFALSPLSAAETFPSLGQGQMAGRVTETSVILQSRLTTGTQLVDGDLAGAAGVAYFEVSTQQDFSPASRTEWLRATAGTDYILKRKITGLTPDTRYYYRLVYGPKAEDTATAPTCTFKTLGGTGKVSFSVVTGMNYFFFHEGSYRKGGGYRGADKHLGYPALATILKLKPDFFVATGDTVYFD